MRTKIKRRKFRGRKFWTEVKNPLGRRGFILKRYKCSVCSRTFYGILQHIRALTRNSDVEHAKLYIDYYTSIGREAEAREKIRGWRDKHAASIRILDKV